MHEQNIRATSLSSIQEQSSLVSVSSTRPQSGLITGDKNTSKSVKSKSSSSSRKSEYVCLPVCLSVCQSIYLSTPISRFLSFLLCVPVQLDPNHAIWTYNWSLNHLAVTEKVSMSVCLFLSLSPLTLCLSVGPMCLSLFSESYRSSR